MTADQRRAIETLEGPLVVAAGAGSGKTGVVTRRFVHAIATGFAEVDQILTITFTKKAAAEMMQRIRKMLRDRETICGAGSSGDERMNAACRRIESAQISTIDSFCTALLRANALAAGIDPGFGVAEESRANLMRQEAFETCLQDLLENRGDEEKDEVIEFITAYDPNRKGELFKIIESVYATLRSQGRPAKLPKQALPDLEALERALRAAIADARAAFGQLSEPSPTQEKGIERIAEMEAALDVPDLAARINILGEAQLDLRVGNLKEEFQSVNDLHDAYIKGWYAHASVKTLDFIRELLESFDREYKGAKQGLGLLDFADLNQKTMDLLIGNPHILEKVRSRYRMVMVDEFQDTNRLQHEVIRLISGPNLMVVGDENQSIYGFRDADVTRFQEEKKKADEGGYLLELKQNFRSQQEILDFVDYVFGCDEMLAPGYLELEAVAGPDVKKEDCRVEIMLVENAPSRDNPEKRVGIDTTRRAEARLIAERLRELFDDKDSGYCAGDAAILLLGRNQAEIYRDALTRAGVRSYLAIGASYHGKLELSDVVSMFKLIINPLDDLAMLSVLRSPMVGLSDDALYWLGQPVGDKNMRRAPIWAGLAGPERLKRLDGPDRARLDDFVERLGELRLMEGRKTLRALAAAVIKTGDYAANILAGTNGRQNYANLMKLLDLAVAFEECWGNSLADFTGFLQHQKEVEVREAEAPTETEGAASVRIMTMHGAKGLEFPLVVLPNLQSPGKNNFSDAVLVDHKTGDRIGLKYKASGGGKSKVFDYDELQKEEKERSLNEKKRLLYVAMTRARRHLIISASEPRRDDRAPFKWLLDRLEIPWGRDADEDGCRLSYFGEAAVKLKTCDDPEDCLDRNGESGKSDSVTEFPKINTGIASMPDPAIYVPAEISPTALDTFAACPRRYFFEQVLGLGGLFPDESAGKESADTEAASRRLSNTGMGSLIHKVLEKDMLNLETGLPGPKQLQERAAEAGLAPTGFTQADMELARRLLDNFLKAGIAAELLNAARAGGLKTELGFSTLLGRTILKGQLDALCCFGGSGSREDTTLVVDYKTGNPGAGLTGAGSETSDRYRLQMSAYALAALRLHAGPVKVVLLYLGGAEPLQIEREYRPSEAAALEAQLKEAMGKMETGEFPALMEFDAYHCSHCPGGPARGAVCPAGRRLN